MKQHPDESRMDVIGQNGNDGTHYDWQHSQKFMDVLAKMDREEAERRRRECDHCGGSSEECKMCIHNRNVDMVNHPPHYTNGNVECIDAIEGALTEEEFRGYCKGNAIKYIWRERMKGGGESIQKALWYLNLLDNQ